MPGTAAPFLERLTEHLKVGLAALEEAREAGRVTIGTDGVMHLSGIEALPPDGIPKRTRDLIFKQIGAVQFADMLTEMDAHTGFSEVLRSRKARDANELVSLYAALIAHGTEMEVKNVAAMIPKLDPAHISTAMRLLEMPGRLPRANDRVVEFQRTHPITELCTIDHVQVQKVQNTYKCYWRLTWELPLTLQDCRQRVFKLAVLASLSRLSKRMTASS